MITTAKLDPNDPKFRWIVIRDITFQFQSGALITKNLLPEDTLEMRNSEGNIEIVLAVNGEKFTANPTYIECWSLLERKARVKNPDYAAAEKP